MKNDSLKVQRTHDALYLDESRYNEPKQMFKFIAANAFDRNEKLSSLSLCDFGCVAGEFLYLLGKNSSDCPPCRC